MRFDIADPERLTRRTDIAFWLHLLAAPLIVHSLIQGMVTEASKLSPGSAVAIMLVFLALSFVAVLIDRRAMLVSGLSYAGVAFWALIRQAGYSDMTTPLTILTLGAFVLLLSRLAAAPCRNPDYHAICIRPSPPASKPISMMDHQFRNDQNAR